MNQSYQDIEVTAEELEYWESLVSKYNVTVNIQRKEDDDDIFSEGTRSLREPA